MDSERDDFPSSSSASARLLEPDGAGEEISCCSRHCICVETPGIQRRHGASIDHAMVVIFLEFFSIGLLMTIMPNVLHIFFKDNVFLVNGVAQGIKGFLSFLCSPLIGVLADVYGRKWFLFLTVLFTTAPVALLFVSNLWLYTFALAISGIFSVTFSVVFAYAADITNDTERSVAYGKVTAMFAASLITSPAIGYFVTEFYGTSATFALSCAIALLDLLYIVLVVPESLPERLRSRSVSWKQTDPFAFLRTTMRNKVLVRLALMVFLSYLPEAGETLMILQYLEARLGFTPSQLAVYIALMGVLSIFSQTWLLSRLLRRLGDLHVIRIGLALGCIQMFLFSVVSHPWMSYFSGCIAALATLTYPAISALISKLSNADQQGASLGMVTGIRMLCNGMGPALFGVLFQAVGFQMGDGSTDANGGVASDTTLSSSAAVTVLAPIVTTAFANLTDIASSPSAVADTRHVSALAGLPFFVGGLLTLAAFLTTLTIKDSDLRHGLSAAADASHHNHHHHNRRHSEDDATHTITSADLVVHTSLPHSPLIVSSTSASKDE